MPMGKISLREILSRPTRALLTFTSIVLGVAAVVSVFLTTSNTRAAQKQMLRVVSGRADLEIVANGARGFPITALEETKQVPGVKLVVPTINRPTTLFAGERTANARVLGIDPQIDQEIRDYKIVQGHTIENSKEILIDGSFAVSMGIKLDDEIRLLGRGGLTPVKVVGIVEPSGGSGVAVGSSVYMHLRDARDLFRTGRNIDQLQLILEDPSKRNEILERLKQSVPAEATVQAPATRSQMAEEAMFATENGLHMAIAFALLIALFIIYNTFQMSVGERRKQLGILRALGTTRGQAVDDPSRSTHHEYAGFGCGLRTGYLRRDSTIARIAATVASELAIDTSHYLADLDRSWIRCVDFVAGSIPASQPRE